MSETSILKRAIAEGKTAIFAFTAASKDFIITPPTRRSFERDPQDPESPVHPEMVPLRATFHMMNTLVNAAFPPTDQMGRVSGMSGRDQQIWAQWQRAMDAAEAHAVNETSDSVDAGVTISVEYVDWLHRRAKDEKVLTPSNLAQWREEFTCYVGDLLESSLRS